MNYAELKTFDIANGPGVRVSLFVSGCRHHCKNCFNEIAWDFEYGKVFDEEAMEYLLQQLDNEVVRGFTLLGGEPLDPKNQSGVLSILKKIKERCPKKDIWCYTGYVWEKDILGWMIQECKETKEILSMIDVLVDGPFIEAQKDISLRFCGSRNQRLIDLKRTKKENQLVLWED